MIRGMMTKGRGLETGPFIQGMQDRLLEEGVGQGLKGEFLYIKVGLSWGKGLRGGRKGREM